MLGRNTGARVVDSLLVLLGPSAKFFEDSHLLGRDGSVFLGTDIEQQIATHAQTVYEGTEQDIGRLVVGIDILESPRVVHGHTQLPVLVGRTYHGHTLFRRSVVAVALDARVDDGLGIGGAQQIDDTFRVPSLGRLLPVAVEPIEIGLKLRIELLELCHVKVYELLPAGWVVLIARLGTRHVGIVGMRPVEQRIVETELEPVAAHLFDKGGDEVTPGRCTLGGAQTASLGVPQRHTIVVLGGDDRVARATLLDQVYPCLGVVIGGSKSLALRHILVVGQILVKERPALRHAIDGIDTPVDEDTQLGIGKPLHVFFTLFYWLLRTHCLRHHARQHQHPCKDGL